MVARRRGWGGDPPSTDAEARARMIMAATDLMTARSSALLLADVADSLSVARQTVYKYFASADELVTAAATTDIEGIIDRIAGRVDAAGGPVGVVVDCILAALDLVRESSVLHHAFRYTEHTHLAAQVVTADTLDHCVVALRQTGVAWSALGYTHDDLDDIAELALRMLQSLLISPVAGDQSPEALRARLVRWIGPSVTAIASGQPSSGPSPVGEAAARG